MLTNFLYIIVAVLLLCLLIVVHELGHFIAGRLCGIGVIEFSVGFGPKLLGWRRKDTDYSIRAIPLGGYCKFVGEDDESSAPDAMNNMPVWKRFLTVAAGPAMNVLFAYLAAVLMLCMFYGTISPSVDTVVDGSPAQQAQLMPGDVITAANGSEIAFDAEGTNALREIIQASDSVQLTVDRGGETIELALTPEWNEEAGAYQIGVMLGTVPVRLSFGEAVRYSGFMMAEMSTAMVDVLRQLFTNKEVLESTMGPVGIITTVSRDVSQGMHMVINWIVVISLNLGIMNLLPVPGLDGGRLLFLIVEGVRRKPIPVEKEAWVHAAGLILLLCFVAFITFKDVARLFIGG